MIVRVRRESGYIGGPNTVYHADIVAHDFNHALELARKDLVTNWRWIDSFDISNYNYICYKVLYEL
jgi:hypothetical protein